VQVAELAAGDRPVLVVAPGTLAAGLDSGAPAALE
jgi:hypothetical protein